MLYHLQKKKIWRLEVTGNYSQKRTESVTNDIEYRTKRKMKTQAWMELKKADFKEQDAMWATYRE
jgi:hypothetical protein